MPITAKAFIRPLRGSSVLVVDGDEAARDDLTFLLVVLGAEVEAVETMREALEHARAHPPHVVFSELLLPDGRGSELLRAIAKQLPVVRGVALTASAAPEDAVELRAAGFTHHLLKPAHPMQIMDALSQLSPKRPA